VYVIKTGSVDETQQIQSALRERMTGQHTGGGPFSWRATHVALGNLTLSTSAYSGSVHGHADNVGKYWLSVTTAAGGRAAQGRDTATFAAGAGNIVTPGMSLDVSLGEGFQGLLVGIPASSIEHALAALHGRTVPPPRFTLAVDYASGPSAEVARLLAFVVDEAKRGSGLVHTPAIAARLEEAIVLAILRLPNDSAPAARKEPTFALDLVKRVEDYLAAHAAEPITLAEIAKVAHAGIRTVQALFQRHRGYAPMSFLRTRRLELARARLVSSDPGTIAEIALDCGFTHLGRFSIAYRAKFGERPTETRLRRSHAG